MCWWFMLAGPLLLLTSWKRKIPFIFWDFLKPIDLWNTTGLALGFVLVFFFKREKKILFDFIDSLKSGIIPLNCLSLIEGIPGSGKWCELCFHFFWDGKSSPISCRHSQVAQKGAQEEIPVIFHVQGDQQGCARGWAGADPRHEQGPNPVQSWSQI